jgi:hypothetical protein
MKNCPSGSCVEESWKIIVWTYVNISMANPDPEVRSSGRVYNVTLHHSARPDLWFGIPHWYIYIYIHTRVYVNVRGSYGLFIANNFIYFNFLIYFNIRFIPTSNKYFSDVYYNWCITAVNSVLSAILCYIFILSYSKVLFYLITNQTH